MTAQPLMDWMGTKLSIADNIKAVRERMEYAASESGLGPRELILVAAAKTMDCAAVRETIAGGADAIGENRVQEFEEKLAKGAYEGAEAHFIAHLQKNKAKKVVWASRLIQSVDSIELLSLIDRLAGSLGIVQDVLLQVNLELEQSKGGIPPDELQEALQASSEARSLRVRGLMAIPPAGMDSAGNRNYFSRMYRLFVDSGAKKYDNVSMDFLSMGMSGDFEDALIEGANMVRIGTAIFGGR